MKNHINGGPDGQNDGYSSTAHDHPYEFCKREKKKVVWGSDPRKFDPVDQQMLPWTQHIHKQPHIALKLHTVCVVQ